MISSKDNTVSAEGQMRYSTDVSYLGDPQATHRLLILGNSITRHGPAPHIGWHGDHGMAASSPAHDYVHVLYDKLSQAGESVYIMVRQASYWEMHLTQEDILARFADERAFAPDIVLFRLGENVSQADRGSFYEAMRALVEYVCPPSGRVVFTNCFLTNPPIDEAIAALAASRAEMCVDIAFANADQRTMALGQYAHEGVSMHPSDYGMACIAQAIFPFVQF